MTTETKIPGLPIVAEAYIENFTWPSHEAYVRAHEVMQATVQAVRQSPEVQARQWQPIETAPKDGRTLLLGRFNSHGNWRTMRGQWMSEDYISNHWDEPDCASPGWFETSVEADDPPNCWPTEPTHWMPLPAPPSDAAMEKKT